MRGRRGPSQPHNCHSSPPTHPMRPVVILAIVSLSLTLAACTVGGEPEIDCDTIDDDAACTCEDGSHGRLVCTSQLLTCVCDGEPTWSNSAPVDAGHEEPDTGDDAGDADASAGDTGDTGDASAGDTGDTGDASAGDADDAGADDAGDADP